MSTGGSPSHLPRLQMLSLGSLPNGYVRLGFICLTRLMSVPNTLVCWHNNMVNMVNIAYQDQAIAISGMLLYFISSAAPKRNLAELPARLQSFPRAVTYLDAPAR